MKHFNARTGPWNVSHRSHPVNSGNLKKLTTALLFLIGFWLHQPLAAQQGCTLICNANNPNAPSQMTVNGQCQGVLVPDAILEAPEECPGPKTLIVREYPSNTLIADLPGHFAPVNRVRFDQDAQLLAIIKAILKEGEFLLGLQK